MLAKTEALPLLEVELRLMVHDLVWVPDLLAPAPAIQLPAAADAEDGEPRPTALAAKASSTGQGLAAMWASWIQALLSASSRVARLDAAEGVPLPGYCCCRWCCSGREWAGLVPSMSRGLAAGCLGSGHPWQLLVASCLARGWLGKPCE